MRRLLVVLLLLASAPSVHAAGRDVRVVAHSPVCGGSTLIETGRHRSCVHPTADGYDGRTQARWAVTPPVTAPPVCYGDGTTGSRVQLIYGYPSGHPSRAATVVPLITKAIAPRMQAMIKAASKGQDLGIRFAFNPGCAGLSVPVVRFPASVLGGSDGKTADGQFGRMISTLMAAGYDRSDRKYIVVWDWWNNAGICGLGELMPDNGQPTAVNLHEGLPTVGARTEVAHAAGVGGQVPLPRYAAVWAHAFAPRGPDCWEMDQSRAGAEVHELFHTLGAVQLGAPHSDGGGHCTDMPSVMCVGGKPTVPSCAVQKVQVLDCGMDDFWNPTPASGSYLDHGPNIAASRFFGPQPQDRLAASPV